MRPEAEVALVLASMFIVAMATAQLMKLILL